MTIEKTIDPNQYLVEAINKLTQAQMAFSNKLDNHITKSNERFDNLEKKQRKQATIIESLYSDYIECLIKDAAEYYKISTSRVDYDIIKKYREETRHQHDLRFDSIRSRIWRIKYLTDAEKIGTEYFNSLYLRINKTEEQIREEPHAIAIHFKDGHGQATIYDAIELNKQYMSVAQDLIFELEDKYGIDDNDREHGIQLARKLWNCGKRISEYSDKDYIEWTEQMVKEYSRLLKTTSNKAANIMFSHVRNFGNKREQFNIDFEDNFSNNIHKVLSDKKIRERFPNIIAGNFTHAWNRRMVI